MGIVSPNMAKKVVMNMAQKIRLFFSSKDAHFIRWGMLVLNLKHPQTRTIIFSLPWFVIVMCLAVPGLVESIDGRTAIVDFGGVKREAIIDLMEEGTIVPGVYVLVHTGFVIQKLEKEEALETLAIWREVLSAAEES
jgi:hydrogenase expression/formation protein HypC